MKISGHSSFVPLLAVAVLALAGTLLPASLRAAEAAAPPRAQQAGQPGAYMDKLRSVIAVNVRDVRLETLLTGLDEPWAFEFLSTDEVIITQIRGRLSRYQLATGELTEISGLPAIATQHEQTGLLDVELHPDYTSNGRIYFSYSRSDAETGRFFLTAVATAELRGNRLHGVRDILRAEPYTWSPSNFGGALAFDAAGFLYVAIGDRSEHVFGQQGHRLQGKILRLHDDGSVPRDNPFVDDANVDDRIYALGVRNPQGLHYDTVTGELFETEHGPTGGDEVNMIVAGGNYGWAAISYGQNHSGESMGAGTHRAGLLQPLWYYLPSIATSPVTRYRGAMFPEWDGDLLVGALRGRHISKLDLDVDRVRAEYALVRELKDRIRDIKVAADGSIFILSQVKGLHRLYRVPGEPAAEKPIRSQVIYQMVCAGCHDTGAANTPQLNDPAQWTAIRAQPREQVYRHVIDGYGEMPERGLCYICEDKHIEAAVDYMFEQLQDPAAPVVADP